MFAGDKHSLMFDARAYFKLSLVFVDPSSVFTADSHDPHEDCKITVRSVTSNVSLPKSVLAPPTPSDDDGIMSV